MVKKQAKLLNQQSYIQQLEALIDATLVVDSMVGPPFRLRLFVSRVNLAHEPLTA
jgi:hypothetical protein